MSRVYIERNLPFSKLKKMEREQFEELVAKAVDALPEHFKESLLNIDVVVEDWPSREKLEEVGVNRRQDLLGLYEGIPLTKRGRGYDMVLPDKITIFQKPIEMRYHSEDQLIKRIQGVVRHEIAHYFGISDRRLREMGRY